MHEPNPLSLFWEGFQPACHHCPDERTLVITLQPQLDGVPVCRGCGHATGRVHDVSERWVRERDLFVALPGLAAGTGPAGGGD